MYNISIISVYLNFHIQHFIFNDTATTEIYTLSLHDALPICFKCPPQARAVRRLGHTVVTRSRRGRSEEHTSELQSQSNLVCRLLLEKKKKGCRIHASYEYGTTLMRPR